MKEKVTYINNSLIGGLIKDRKVDSTKHDFGHALLIAGSIGKMGAAVLSASAALRAGCGLLTVHVPSRGEVILQSSLPEAMVSLDNSSDYFSIIPDLTYFSAIGVGPGLGKNELTKKALCNLLTLAKVPLVLDADALNCLSEDADLIAKLPSHAILTPHAKEFERLVGKFIDEVEVIQMQLNWSIKNKVVLVRKAHNTVVTTPEGDIFINTSGNPGLAKGGTGDVLTGMITSFLAQGFSPAESALLGVYIHGRAGDIAVHSIDEKSLFASDVISCISSVFKEISLSSQEKIH